MKKMTKSFWAFIGIDEAPTTKEVVLTFFVTTIIFFTFLFYLFFIY